jgi:hypothetical protein
VIQAGSMDPVLGVAELPAIVNIPFGPEIDTTPAFDLTGAGHTTEMGLLLAQRRAPDDRPLRHLHRIGRQPCSSRRPRCRSARSAPLHPALRGAQNQQTIPWPERRRVGDPEHGADHSNLPKAGTEVPSQLPRHVRSEAYTVDN